jgi:hypothetical protein
MSLLSIWGIVVKLWDTVAGILSMSPFESQINADIPQIQHHIKAQIVPLKI